VRPPDGTYLGRYKPRCAVRSPDLTVGMAIIVVHFSERGCIFRMSLRNRSSIEGPAIFFLTTSTHNWVPFPNQPSSLKVIEKILFRTTDEKRAHLFAYVIMPTHLHLIAGSGSGGLGISKFMHSLKGRIREDLRGKGKFWQDRFDDLLILTENQFSVKLNYIHYNPTRAKLVENPEDWPFSSYLDWEDHDGSRGIKFIFEELIVSSGEAT
jgi:REP element-mobilizing transposase RayT